MKLNTINTAIFAGAAAVVALTAFSASDAYAKGGKEIFTETYEFNQPMHGYEGHATNNYYCTYKRFPVRKCKWNGSREVCKVVKWRLEETCY